MSIFETMTPPHQNEISWISPAVMIEMSNVAYTTRGILDAESASYLAALKKNIANDNNPVYTQENIQLAA